MRYRCLILDHDDTVVKSTPDIHYPSFVEAVRKLRPKEEPPSLKEFVSYCFNPGFTELCRDIMKFSKEEQACQYDIWRSFTRSRIPLFYEGFPEFLKKYKAAGGIISVVSHSESQQISRDYEYNCAILPDLIFGWDREEEQRKPNPYPVFETMKGFNLESSDILVLDDLKPGLDMARKCNVNFAGAGWSHIIPEIGDYMKIHSDYYFNTVGAFT
ncbi:MAG: hydrolase, partial [Eubacterium sp.]|nr:hydrolase [Eubacterium sp.]